MKRRLLISEDIALPIETVTATGVVYGMKGMGKTNFGSVIAEELAAHKVRFSIIDPMGVWWGLQYGAQKSAPGIEVLIMGGIHGDIPIEPTAGAVVADLVADESVSVVIDISRHSNGKMWGRGERIRFVRDYAVRLYERQGEKRRPLLQIIDEAARYVPQTIAHGDPDSSACLSAITAITEEGRNLGLGILFLTLRSARLNKDVAELADYLIAFRTVGPNSTKAILDWFGSHVPKERWNELLADLRTLPMGTALVISPGWLKFEGKAMIRMRTTFDSSQTPKIGHAIKAPSGRARKPDLDKYQQRMKETIERAEADNPRKLKARIVELERERDRAITLASKVKPAPARVETKIEKREVRIFKGKDLERFTSGVATMERVAKELAEKSASLQASLNQATAINTGAGSDHPSAPRSSLPHPTSEAARRAFGVETRPGTAINVPAQAEPYARMLKAPANLPTDGDGKIGKGELITLRTIVQYGRVEREQLSVLTGYTKSSRNTYLNRLLGVGLIARDGKEFQATLEGIKAAGEVDTPPTGEELIEWWMKRLPAGEKAVLAYVLKHRGQAVDREAISEGTGYTKSSRNTYIHRLQSRRLLELGAGPVRPADSFL